MKKKVLALLLSAAMVLSLAACGEDSGNDNNQPTNTNPPSTSQPSTSGDNEGDTPEVPAETVVIRYGTHWINGIDPNYVDPVTGEYTMDPAPRQAALVALQAVKDTYNVEIEFLQYPVDVQTDLMTSVLAGDPICDLALLWGGVEPTILT